MKRKYISPSIEVYRIEDSLRGFIFCGSDPKGDIHNGDGSGDKPGPVDNPDDWQGKGSLFDDDAEVGFSW